MQGIQLYVNVVDIDDTTQSEFMDSFAIDLAAETYVAGTSQLVNVTGTFQLASTVLRIGVECQPGFIGESCVPINTCTTDSCSNNGICIQNDTGFTCVCMCDFTGDTCETNLGPAESSESSSSTFLAVVTVVCSISIVIMAFVIVILAILLVMQRKSTVPYRGGTSKSGHPENWTTSEQRTSML